MTQTKVINAYFDWIYDKVCKGRFPRGTSYRRLLLYLHDTEFVYLLSRDASRAEDGITLRYRFSRETGYDEGYLNGPCSVLEMMIALSIRCEEDTMDDPDIGDRTGQWFWSMIVNLGLGSMNDAKYDRRYVEEIIVRFLNREYEPDGRGGLFTVKNCSEDLRDVSIWYQMNWYLGSIT